MRQTLKLAAAAAAAAGGRWMKFTLDKPTLPLEDDKEKKENLWELHCKEEVQKYKGKRLAIVWE